MRISIAIIVAILFLFLSVHLSPITALFIHEFIAILMPTTIGESFNISTRSNLTAVILNVSFLVFALTAALTLAVLLLRQNDRMLLTLLFIINVLIFACSTAYFWPGEMLIRVSGFFMLVTAQALLSLFWLLVFNKVNSSNKFESSALLFILFVNSAAGFFLPLSYVVLMSIYVVFTEIFYSEYLTVSITVISIGVGILLTYGYWRLLRAKTIL